MCNEYFASGSYGRLRMGMALRGPAFTSAGRNAGDFAFARDLALPISIHAGMAGIGDAVGVLERYGLLGSDVNYVHGNFLTDREWDLLADSGGTVTITPSTDMLMQFGTFPATGAALGAGPADVETVIVGGDVVKRDGKLTGDHATGALELMYATRRHLRA